MKRLALIPLALLHFACAPKPNPLEVFGTVQNFELTAQTGQPLHLADLQGHVWIADTIFTTCTGPCPMMSARMKALNRELQDLPGLRFVSVTVDPEHDTPTALNDYAGKFQAAPTRWYFLTGTAPALEQLTKGSLALSTVNGDLSHSTRFALIDGQARIRGYYVSTNPQDMKRLAADARALATL